MSLKFELEHLALMKKGIELFNAQKYWECHEEFEHHWLEEPSAIRNVYWAVIQVAAAMIHYRDQNIIGAKGLITKAKEKFNRVEKFEIENEILNKNLSWRELKILVRNVPDEPILQDFERLFQFRFKDPNSWN